MVIFGAKGTVMRRGLVALGGLVLFITAGFGSAGAVLAHERARDRDRGRHHYTVYWDQNEEEDFLRMPSGRSGLLIPPWDPNGQLCIVPDGSGRFVVGYNPTLPGQNNPGSALTPKSPPVGEALYDRHARFTGQTLFTAGPFHLPGQTVGGDIPPDGSSGTFNNNGTFTGCAFDSHGNLFASDLGTAQGDFPPPDDGRIIEWFAPSYRSACVVFGPTDGGVGPHHVDGTGGLRQPGDLAVDHNGDLLVPEAGALQNGLPGGRVLRFDHTSLPRRSRNCGPDGLYPRSRIRSSVFVQGSLTTLPFPIAIARDPICKCWAVDSTFGDPAVAWFDDAGNPVRGHSTIPGEPLAQIGQDPNGYNPFGIAFAPDGTLYLVDIHITCTGLLSGCGPASHAGRVLRFTFKAGQPNPPTAIASGLDFPTSVTVCTRDDGPCPRRRG